MPTQSNLMGSGCPALQAQASVGLAKTGLTALGTNQGSALALPSDGNVFSTVAAGTGAILPATSFNIQLLDSLLVFNHGATALLVYPPVGGTISTLAANTAVSIPTGKFCTFIVTGNNAYGYGLSS